MDRETRAEYLRQQIGQALSDLRERSEAEGGESPVGPTEHACQPAMEALEAVREGEPVDPTELERLGGSVAELELHLKPQYDGVAHVLLHAGQGMVELAGEIADDS